MNIEMKQKWFRNVTKESGLRTFDNKHKYKICDLKMNMKIK
jgi:hypothetical protein